MNINAAFICEQNMMVTNTVIIAGDHMPPRRDKIICLV